MSVQILIGALLIGDVPNGDDRTRNHATSGDGRILLATSTAHSVPIETPAPAALAWRPAAPAHDTAAARTAPLRASAITPLFRPLLRHILLPPGI